MILEEQINLTLLSHRLAKIDKTLASQVSSYRFSNNWGLFVTYEFECVEFHKKILFERTEYIEMVISYLKNYQRYKDQIKPELHDEICKISSKLKLLVNK